MTKEQQEALEVCDRLIKWSLANNDAEVLAEAVVLRHKVESNIAKYRRNERRLQNTLKIMGAISMLLVGFEFIVIFTMAFVISHMISEILKIENLINDND